MEDVVPGYFRNNVHVVNHASRFALYHGTTDTSDEEM